MQEIEFQCILKRLHQKPLIREVRNAFGFLDKKRSLGELQLKIHGLSDKIVCPSDCTSNTSNPDFEIFCSGIASNNQEHAAWHAFDDNRDTTWAAEISSKGYVGWVSLNGKVLVKAYQLRGRPSFTQYPTSWNFEGSDDGVNWNIIDIQTNISDYINQQPRLFLIPENNRPYKYHRINVLSAVNHASLTLVQAWNNDKCQVSLPLTEDSKNEITGEEYSTSNVSFNYLGGQKCAVFNGSNSYVNLGRNIPFNQKQMTIECLVYLKEYKNSRIFSKTENGAFNIEIYGDEQSQTQVLFYINGSYRYLKFDKTLIPLNKWTHIISTYDGAYISFYINNILINSIEASGEISNTNAYLLLGAEPSNTGIESGYYFNGGIKLFKMYTYGFTSEDVNKSYSKVAEICK